ncbi:hypothetical protein C8N47_11157 [Mangrovibacterium marinum]|uniref:Uncharacterized protein n=1 Tax=Mangrovibacterium marinum TaxID=1639118 RepID=A0A2T5C0E2_9BACT|nr:hypothetical protein C8N47_11157 [Mangrovibacterium marinum]
MFVLSYLPIAGKFGQFCQKPRTLIFVGLAFFSFLNCRYSSTNRAVTHRFISVVVKSAFNTSAVFSRIAQSAFCKTEKDET